MKYKHLLVLFGVFIIFLSCKEESDIPDPIALSTAVEGKYTGILLMNGDTISPNYEVELVTNSSTSVILYSDDCNNIEVLLSNNSGVGITGQADTLTNFSYLFSDNSLEFFISNNDVFKVYRGEKN